jgi:hypothetical protein
MGPFVRCAQESVDVLRERLSTTISGDAWAGGPTFELTDCGGGVTGGLDGARTPDDDARRRRSSAPLAQNAVLCCASLRRSHLTMQRAPAHAQACA